MIIHTLDPTILQIGSLEVRWYSLMYIIGIIFIYFIANHIAKKQKLKIQGKKLEDLIVYLAFGMLIGGRLGYFLFYDIGIILKDPLELLMLWHGGMSFHGGLLGTIIACIIYCRLKKADFWQIADLIVIPLGIALMLGRIGNFINAELIGRTWNGLLCVDYTHNPFIINPPELCRYPSQLMEAAKNLLIFIVMWTTKDVKWPKGFRFWLFVTMYGVLRFMIEFFREPDSQIGYILGWMTEGQILCALMMIVGGIMLALVWKRTKHL